MKYRDHPSRQNLNSPQDKAKHIFFSLSSLNLLSQIVTKPQGDFEIQHK